MTNLLKGNTRFKKKSQVCDEPIRIIGLPQTFEYAVITKGRRLQRMSDKQLKSNMPSVPIWKKMNLTVEEASEYSGIGTSKIKELSNSEDCPFVLWNGAKRLIKRKQFEEYLSSQYSL